MFKRRHEKQIADLNKCLSKPKCGPRACGVKVTPKGLKIVFINQRNNVLSNSCNIAISYNRTYKKLNIFMKEI